MLPSSLTDLRPYPYPYRAMLAICSDLDQTPTASLYLEMMKYLNTAQATIFGQGINLEVGNTLYFKMPEGEFCYDRAQERERAQLRDLIRSGHIDCFHSFGDLVTERSQVKRILDHLDRHQARIRVWVDHAQAPSNLGSDIMRGRGDLEHDAVYHADLTAQFGVEYYWLGRVSAVIGQQIKRHYHGFAQPHSALASARTIAKDCSKTLLGALGQAKYSLHYGNSLLAARRLRDGRVVKEFMRANPYYRGVDLAATAEGFAQVVSERMLRVLAERGGRTILYTHLGKFECPRTPFSNATQAAFSRLAQWAQRDILVTTTERLLDYTEMRQNVRIQRRTIDDRLHLTIDSTLPTARLAGLCFYCDEPARVDASVNGRTVDLQRNPRDHTGRPSVSVPWSKLTFPDLD